MPSRAVLRFVLFLAALVPACSATGSLHGQVRHLEERSSGVREVVAVPLDGQANAPLITVTDERGFYRIEPVEPGRYLVYERRTLRERVEDFTPHWTSDWFSITPEDWRSGRSRYLGDQDQRLVVEAKKHDTRRWHSTTAPGQIAVVSIGKACRQDLVAQPVWTITLPSGWWPAERDSGGSNGYSLWPRDERQRRTWPPHRPQADVEGVRTQVRGVRPGRYSVRGVVSGVYVWFGQIRVHDDGTVSPIDAKSLEEMFVIAGSVKLAFDGFPEGVGLNQIEFKTSRGAVTSILYAGDWLPMPPTLDLPAPPGDLADIWVYTTMGATRVSIPDGIDPLQTTTRVPYPSAGVLRLEPSSGPQPIDVPRTIRVMQVFASGPSPRTHNGYRFRLKSTCAWELPLFPGTWNIVDRKNRPLVTVEVRAGKTTTVPLADVAAAHAAR